MNSQIAYLQWTKQNFPAVYQAAVAKVQRKTALGGLGDDLLSDISFDPDSLSASDYIDYSPSASNPNAGNASYGGTDWSGIIGSIASAVPVVAGSIVQTQQQLQLIQTNAQLAAQGRPLVNSLTNPGLAATSGNSLLILGVLGLGVLAVAMSGNRSGGSSTKGV